MQRKHGDPDRHTILRPLPTHERPRIGGAHAPFAAMVWSASSYYFFPFPGLEPSSSFGRGFPPGCRSNPFTIPLLPFGPPLLSDSGSGSDTGDAFDPKTCPLFRKQFDVWSPCETSGKRCGRCGACLFAARFASDDLARHCALTPSACHATLQASTDEEVVAMTAYVYLALQSAESCSVRNRNSLFSANPNAR